MPLERMLWPQNQKAGLILHSIKELAKGPKISKPCLQQMDTKPGMPSITNVRERTGDSIAVFYNGPTLGTAKLFRGRQIETKQIEEKLKDHQQSN